MSYSLKVDVQQRKPADEKLPGGSKQASSRAGSSPDTARADVTSNGIAFSAGNPRVEHLTGVVHLYRHVPSADAADSSSWSQSEPCGDQLAVLAVSPDMGVADFCTFAGGYLPSIRDMRFVRRDDSHSSCLVLLRFDSPATATAFYQEHNNKPFWTLEPDVICRLVYVKDLQYDDVSSGGSGSPALPAAGQTELPTCPVCLERLDTHISGVVTTVCNHQFHNECLMRWADTSCPVCRYCLNNEGSVSHCSTCSTAADLWICLICGHIGCGRYRSGHANQHWKETNHCYALELDTQRVWDYASDGYVHRLIQSKTDGKLVEVPSPLPAPRGAEDAAAGTADTRYDADMEEAIVSSKLDAIGAEYNSLLASQLDAQRHWFESRHAQVVAELEARCTELAAVAAQNEEAAKVATAAAKAAEHLRKVTDAKLAKQTQKARDLLKERDVLEALNSQMRKNQVDLKAKLEADSAAAAAALADKDAQLADLREQVRDLMMYIEGQRLVGEADPEMGLGQGSVSVPTAQPAAISATPKRKTGRKR